MDKRHEKITNYEKNLEKKDEKFYHLKKDNYLADEDSTLIKIMGQLTLENVNFQFKIILYSITSSGRIFFT